MFFRIKEGCGKHTDLDGTEYKAGSIIESETDLCKAFRMKFELVAEMPLGKQLKKPKIPTKGRGTKKASAQKETDPLAVYGNNVTEKFEEADPDAVLIYHKKGSGYSIIDPKDNKPFNEEPLTKKSQVVPFLVAEVYEEDSEEE